ncbi:MAG: DUF1345 domain-containing protein [Reyranella sp.]|uniref:DUF1345 domain-containing protein n=1 Tax=Reyranella sp. TaxID=1929291 RepID=UPI001AD375FC|nr:DUF1345 domain-containing protein [Reyranella sp.]MBN9091467.1 DUF1345 domain-containing protein [Reyranella sp.]
MVQSRVGKFLVARRRLMLSALVGVVLLVVLPPSIRWATRLLLAWDLTAAVYVGFALHMMLRSDIETCRRRASLYDQGDWMILTVVIGSAAASFAAIFVELAAIKAYEAPAAAGLLITGATVVLSWTFTHVLFTLHYANVYYRPHERGQPGGLDFPGEHAPDYRDFLYYAFVIGCACQTADVCTTSRDMRLISLVHGIVAFAFNTAILALMINVGASLIS